MNKKSKKIIAGVACAMALLIPTTIGIGALAASISNKVPEKTPTAVNPVEDKNPSYQATDTLHLGWDKVDYVNGKAFDGYTLVYNFTDSYQKEAANFIIAHVQKATSKTLSTANATSATWSDDAKYIIFGNEALEKAAGYTSSGYDLGPAGYHIQTIGNSVIIHADEVKGFHLGAIAFLRAVVGYDAFGDGTFAYAKDGSVLPTMDIVERPDFDVLEYKTVWENSASTGSDATLGQEYYALGTSHVLEQKIRISAYGDHNSFAYINPTEHTDKYATWYATDSSNAMIPCTIGFEGVSENLSSYPAQLCYTAHGDATEKAAMQDTVANAIIAKSEDDGTSAGSKHKTYVMFGQQDQDVACGCSSCLAIANKYGNIGPAIIDFLNGVSERVQTQLAAKGDNRQIKIMMFAYQQTRLAPNAQALKDGYKCNDNVCIYLAASRARYSYSMYDAENATDAQAIKDWAKFGELCYWFYNYNTMTYFIPHNSFDVIPATYRFAREYGSSWIADNICPTDPHATGFSAFKEYLTTRLQFNVNDNYGQLKDNFFKTYYGAGGEKMEQFFDEVTKYMTYMRDTLPKQDAHENVKNTNDFEGALTHNSPDKKQYWPINMVKKWNQLCNEAIAALDSSDAMYETYKQHIMIESLFPRYVLGYLHNDSSLHEGFKVDCTSLGLTRYNENGTTLEMMYSEWAEANS